MCATRLLSGDEKVGAERSTCSVKAGAAADALCIRTVGDNYTGLPRGAVRVRSAVQLGRTGRYALFVVLVPSTVEAGGAAAVTGPARATTLIIRFVLAGRRKLP